MYDVIVLGSGVVGMNTAYWLANAGLKTLVVDRQPQAGNDTAYANSGHISVSNAEPLASTATIRLALLGALNENAPLLIRPQLDWRQWYWLTAFLAEALPFCHRRNVAHLVQLGLYSRHLLEQITQQHQLQFHQTQSGCLQLYRNPRSFEHAKHTASLMRTLGCNRQVISAEQAIEMEPALIQGPTGAGNHKPDFCGATFERLDMSGDAHQYCHVLQRVCEQKGVTFWFSTEIQSLHQQNHLVRVQIKRGGAEEIMTAPHIVMACGMNSQSLLAPLKIRLNMQPIVRHSMTIPTHASETLPKMALVDQDQQLTVCQLGGSLRVTGAAMLAKENYPFNEQQCRILSRRCQRLVPDLQNIDKAGYWRAIEPTTPSGMPYVGHTQYPNLWLNTGHGRLEWTLACGSAKLLCDKITQTSPELPPHGAIKIASRPHRV